MLSSPAAHFSELLIRQFEGAAILLLDKRKHFRSLALPLARPAPDPLKNGIELFFHHPSNIAWPLLDASTICAASPPRASLSFFAI